MQRAFNKYGSIEIEGNNMKYRIETQDIGTEDPLEIEKDLKRKLQSIEHQERFLLPYDIQTVNRYMILYYNLGNYSDINSLREIQLEDKITFFLSLVELGKTHEQGLHISWDRMNFVVDKYEQSIKAMLFETDHLKIYDTPEDITKKVKDFIISSMTVLNTVVSLPKRNDFIFTDDSNIQFVEKLYQLESLDDIYMYLETVTLDLISKETASTEADSQPTKGKKGLSLNKPIKQKKKVKPVQRRNNQTVQKKKNTNYTKLSIILGSVAAVLLLLGPLLTPSTEAPLEMKAVAIEPDKNGTIFKGSSEFDNTLVDAYRKAYNSDYTEAYTLLSTIPKDTLNDKDVMLLIEVYYQTENLNLLLDEVPALANDVITYLYTRDKLVELPETATKMVTKNPYIEFETAHLKEEFEYMLTLVDSIQINGRKEQQIIDAYLALDQTEEAHKFAESVGNPDLIKRVEQYRK